ncbi:MAG: DHH family phosphoesterase, partial [Bacteroidota bacterium]
FPPVSVSPVKELLSTAKKIIVTTHHRPDGDAMGSSLGMASFLRSMGHHVTVVTPSDYPDFLHWLPGHQDVLVYDEQNGSMIDTILQADILFCLDFNWLNRTDTMEPVLRKSAAVKVLIDHHLDPEDCYDHTFSYTDACATAELVYEFIDAMGEHARITPVIAECLYCGILTDTNSFRYSSMRASTHRIIAGLMDAGAVNYRIHERVYDNSSENRLRLLGYTLKEKLTVLPEFNTAYIALTDAELQMFNFKAGDTEGVVNYALSIQGIRFAVLFVERDGMVKISFRSKDEFSAKDFASNYFEGGGHRNASGGRSLDTIPKTIERFLSVLPHYKSKLTQ